MHTEARSPDEARSAQSGIAVLSREAVPALRHSASKDARKRAYGSMRATHGNLKDVRMSLLEASRFVAQHRFEACRESLGSFVIERLQWWTRDAAIAAHRCQRRLQAATRLELLPQRR